MEISENVYIKKLEFKGSTGNKSVYITLIKGKKNCLIDTGTSNNFNDIEYFLKEYGVSVKDIDIIINTHCHADHIGSNYLFKKANPNIDIYAHSFAKPYIEDIEKQYSERPVPGFFNLVKEPTKVDKILMDGDVIDIGEKLKIIHTPGHSTGSISIYIQEKSILITGDVVPGTNKKGIPIYEDLNEIRKSFIKIKDTGAKHIISAYDGYCDNISDILNSAENIINNIDGIVKEYLQNCKIRNMEDIDDTLINNAALFVIEKSGLDIKPTIHITNSIRTHIMSALF